MLVVCAALHSCFNFSCSFSGDCIAVPISAGQLCDSVVVAAVAMFAIAMLVLLLFPLSAVGALVCWSAVDVTLLLFL